MQQHKTPTLRRNFSWTFAGNFIYVACQWAMLMVIAKLGSPEVVGKFTLGIAIATPVVMLTNLNLRAVQATDARQKYCFSDYFGLRLLGTGVALLAIVVITIFAKYPWDTSLVILLIGCAKAFESISDVFYGLIQRHEQMERIGRSLMIKGPLSLLFLGIGVYFTGSVVWGALGLAIAWGLVLVSYDIGSGASVLKNAFTIGDLGKPEAIALRPSWNLKTLKQLFWTALPLGLVMMLISLNTNIPRYFIERYLGEHQLGVFAAMAYVMIGGNIVVNALAESASPRLAKHYASGDKAAFRKLVLQLVGVGVLLGSAVFVIALVAGREILTLLYRAEYAQQADIFVLLMLAAGIGYVSSFLGYGITAAQYFRIQTPMFVLVTAVTFASCYWLIPISGMRGAAIALIISAIVDLSLCLGVILHALHKLNKYPSR